MMKVLSIAAGVGLITLAFATAGETRLPADDSRASEEMAAAAGNFLAALSPDQQRRVTYLMKDEERRNFHFFPIPRRGVPFKELNAAQGALAHALLNTGLSQRGYGKAVTIMSLGQILRELEPQSPNPYRDSDQYYVTLFGKPDPKGTWGWRIEGFHLSLNITIVDGKAVTVAPSFLGAHPAVVKEGPRKGLETLPAEEELGRRLARSLDDEQRKVAVHALPKFEETVGGLITGNARKLERGTPRGLPASRMTAGQKELLLSLVKEYVHRHRPDLAEGDLEKIKAAGTEKIHFSWAGSPEPGQPHHYLVQGPAFLIELDNTQDGANHVHCVWRDFENDFGDDLLRRHYAERHGK